MKKYLYILILAAIIIGITYVVPSPKVATSIFPNNNSLVVPDLEGAKYFGNQIEADLDGDGDLDRAFIVTQDPGGSGVFFYAVAQLKTDKGYETSDGYLLGDRISPQPTNMSTNPRHKYVVVFNYADRHVGHPMSEQPSEAKSVYLKIDPVTMRWGIVEPNFEGEAR